ncbi:MAG TPA: 4-hydroxy-3-methylbut-2-enyl diphosphate reductase [Anaerohalosphaeraceae bacterium]|nr:4-hydroxy-3-methylbut-2-enyl diphosphate reductase [Phycisphaerae bacterium]HOK95294.1 4-hydroxy-3-methylbut-2-enyl diphosphate reductase [Anaerohalosphaeraceae bacterium]HOL32099.1 4-hydroxy-3-methylbut-2-enyl diphosphate reductase [Anaerohalosphaeraceae bacterium]HOM76367.1 4-hydroxy-3-methylbut-2-enyl diphosphate reductase [Anaerohalosphaeraceae bacterium]HPC64191.1 4-hydroxy-3-methylbut-2-enyl diphosphate reductase [Anaerohalosphaeraceae bacterium]
MKVLVAEKCGFCPGVRNAINLARKTLAEEGKAYSLGHIIHNEDVVRQLSEAGLKPVDSIDEVQNGTVLIRSHGATQEEFEKINKKGLKIVDATCVLVRRVQKIAKLLNDEGYKVVIIGDTNHPEIRAVVGYAKDIAVVGNEEDLDKLNLTKKIGVICQTTQSPDHFADMIAAIARRGFTEMKIINTLCRETMERQQAAVKLCRQVDIMFVLGGLHSANTRKLAELCKKHNPQTYHLQNWAEFDKKYLFGKTTAGVTAGASTPDEVIEEFVRNLEQWSPPAETDC